MKENKYTVSVSIELLHDLLKGNFNKVCLSNLPEDAVVIGVKEHRYHPQMFNVVVSIPSMPYERMEMEDLMVFDVNLEVVK